MSKSFLPSWLRRSSSKPTFLIYAFPYTHRSSGVRALYRLCHHLNTSGYSAAILLNEPTTAPGLSGWNTPIYTGAIGDHIVIYPEVVSGNPFQAKKVIRWALNNPGLLGGDTTYAENEMVFVYDPQRLTIVNQAVTTPLNSSRILWMGLVDPTHIYPDPRVPKTIDCSFTHKGHALKTQYPLPDHTTLLPLETLTPTMAALGDTLRRTRTLYSYDHYSNVLREAAICGCEVRVMGQDGLWHDPLSCDCSCNILWSPHFKATYAKQFHDNSFIHAFIREVKTRFAVPKPSRNV